MARYWVGGTADWDATAGTKWATTSGGAGGAAVPTTSDDVYFDANSGAVTVTAISAVYCKNLDFTGFNGTLTGSSAAINCYGSVTFSSTVSFPGTNSLNLYGTGSHTLTSNGSVWGGQVTVTAGTYDLADDFSCNGSLFGFRVLAGLFNTNNFDLTCKKFQSTNSSIATANLGSSNIYLTDNASGSAATIINFTNTNFTLNAGTSKFVITGPGSSSRELRFDIGGRTLYDLEFLDCAGAATYTFLTSATVNKLSSTHTNAFTTKLTDGITLTVVDWACNGVSGAKNTVTNTTSTTAGTLAKSGGGTDVLDYCDVSWITGSPSSTWYATNSTDSGNNSGITFSSPYGSNLFFGSNF